MEKKIIMTESAPAPVGPYSQAVAVNGMIFLSGQIALEPDGNIMSGGVEAETERVMENIKAVLKEAGLDMSNIIKATIFLQSMSDFGAVNTIYAKYFDQAPPARECVQAAALPKGALVEISVIAAE